MECSREILIITILIATYCNAQEPIDITNYARDKVNALDKTGKISRGYQAYPEQAAVDNAEYDFIVVGAGSAGSLIANRLSGDPARWKVLLLEAGGEPDLITEVPLWVALAEHTENNWDYKTEADDRIGLGMIDKKLTYPRGKGLGGTSLLNYMVYSRGQKENYDAWNIDGWSYDELLPHFKRFENCKLKKCDSRFRGFHGEVHVEELGYRTPTIDVFIEAAKNSNYTFREDYNAGNMLGVTYLQSTTIDGQRCSGERAFLRPIRRRENLIIHQKSHATKILINKQKRAYAIQFLKDDKVYTARAKKEIILSAGAINSPQLLMLSGIGPRSELEKHQIKVIQDLPVGQKLLDHMTFWGIPLILKDNLVVNQSKILTEESIMEFYNEKKGILKSLGGLEGALFTNVRHPDKNVADIEAVFTAMHLSSDNGSVLRKTLGFSDEIYDYFKPLEGKHVGGAIVILLQPKSHGRIELKSNNAFDHPRIFSGYYNDETGEDMKTMIAGIRETRRVFQSPPLDEIAELYNVPLPVCKQHEFDSDFYWECAIRYLTNTVFHQSTTCKMGRGDDPEAVVDSRLKVLGVSGLRVADISILPDQISGHTNVPAFMIGEKLSAMIAEAYRNVKVEL